MEIKKRIAPIEVHVLGSSGTPYIATFSREGDSLKTTCNCAAGKKRTHCKHRLALLAGDFTSVHGDMQSELLDRLSAIARGTEIESALKAFELADADAKAATERLKRAKKLLDIAMH